MKVALYLEGHALFRNVNSGIKSSYNNQKVIFERSEIPFTEQLSDDYDIIQINTPWLMSLYHVKMSKHKGKKVVIYSHVTAEDMRGVFWAFDHLLWIYKKFLAWTYGSADVVLCPSDYTRNLLLKEYNLKNKLITISNGVDIQRFTCKVDLKKASEKSGSLTIVNAAVVVPRKGVKTFLEVAKHFPEVTFTWYGKTYPHILSSALPLTSLPENATFPGYVPDIVQALCEADILLFPSFEENEGMAILEAAACGLPVVVRDIPVYEGWLIHEENCLKAKTDQEFIAHIQRLKDDPELRQRLSKAGRVLAESRSLQSVGEKLKEIYASLIK